VLSSQTGGMYLQSGPELYTVREQKMCSVSMIYFFVFLVSKYSYHCSGLALCTYDEIMTLSHFVSFLDIEM